MRTSLRHMAVVARKRVPVRQPARRGMACGATDASGYAVGTHSDAAAAALRAFQEQVIGQRPNDGGVFTAAKEDPGCVLTAAMASCVDVMVGRRNQAVQRLASLGCVEERGVDRREFLWWKAAQCFVMHERPAEALRVHMSLAQEYPRDIVAVLFGQYHAFYLGDTRAQLALPKAAWDANREDARFWAFLAFALEQEGHVEEAHDLARRGMQHIEHPWLDHALAHALHTQRDTDAWLAHSEQHAHAWLGYTPWVAVHNGWHTSVALSSKGRPQEALELWDQWDATWGWSEPNMQVDGTQLLWRLELDGVRVGAHRWARLAPALCRSSGWGLHTLLDAIIVYGLTRHAHSSGGGGSGGGGGDGVDTAAVSSVQAVHAVETVMQGLEKRTSVLATTCGVSRWEHQHASVASTMARVARAWARGDADANVDEDAVSLLMTHEHLTGGSHPQREVFQETMTRFQRGDRLEAVTDASDW